MWSVGRAKDGLCHSQVTHWRCPKSRIKTNYDNASFREAARQTGSMISTTSVAIGVMREALAGRCTL